jgi:hypothetical protein
LGNLGSAKTLNLAFTDTISVEDDLSRVAAVGSLEGFQCPGHADAKVI